MAPIFLIGFRAMPAPQVHSFTLTPHPAAGSPAVGAITGRISRTPRGLLVSYVLEGALERLRVPEARAPRFADGLWRHTCFELFVARRGGTGYHEWNFSPSGEWALYAFAREREREPLGAGQTPAALDPHVTACRVPGKLELDAVVPLAALAPGYATAPLALNLSAVVEDDGGALSYWALAHPLDKPDFHHPEAFVLELHEARH
jgi:hypothetical protein